MSQIYGDLEGSYRELPRWLNAVECYSSDTIVRYAASRHEDDNTLILDRVFWAFKPCIEGFRFCKPILQVDGTFLTGKYSGTLLIASSQDGNRRVLPVAFAIVEGYELMRPCFEQMFGALRQKNPRAAACPFNPSLLNLQNDHVSINIWNGGEVTFRARYNFWQHLPAEPVLEVIHNIAFANILTIGATKINNHLVTALVERWRPETHTFHLPNGKCIVTLEDVAYQLGLPIDGDVVTGPTSLDWEMICLNLLVAIPTDKQIIGQKIQMS
ncbi:hypothetical protein Lal_00021862 [Lupinus albus]|nr:hypothetical protein Lal_00021862 [Lupinus albus]